MTDSQRRSTPREMRWRGQPLSELSDEDVIRAHLQTSRALSALIAEQQRRGLFSQEGAERAAALRKRVGD